MLIVWGKRLFAKVERVPGVLHVKTLFFHISYVPLFPRGSYVIAEEAPKDGGLGAAAALVLMHADRAAELGAPVRARIAAYAMCGVEPEYMGIGPVPAVKKVLDRAGRRLDEVGVIELNEAFAAQALAVTRDLELPDDAPHVNPNGGAIALGHPLGASGARLVMTALYQLRRTGGRYALCTMCIGVGQGIALVIERV